MKLSSVEMSYALLFGKKESEKLTLSDSHILPISLAGHQSMPQLPMSKNPHHSSPSPDQREAPEPRVNYSLIFFLFRLCNYPLHFIFFVSFSLGKDNFAFG